MSKQVSVLRSLSSRMKKQIVRLVVGMHKFYIYVHVHAALALSLFAPSTYVCTSFVSDLVLVKSIAIGKMCQGKLDSLSRLVLAAYCVIIITKLSLPFPVCGVAMVAGLLLIFLHICEIKSGSYLGVRLCRFWRSTCITPPCIYSV